MSMDEDQGKDSTPGYPPRTFDMSPRSSLVRSESYPGFPIKKTSAEQREEFRLTITPSANILMDAEHTANLARRVQNGELHSSKWPIELLVGRTLPLEKHLKKLGRRGIVVGKSYKHENVYTERKFVLHYPHADLFEYPSPGILGGLAGLGLVFFRKCWEPPTNLNIEAKTWRELITPRGTPIVYVGETVSKWYLKTWFYRTFEYECVTEMGESVLSVKGYQRGAAKFARVEVFQGDTKLLLGSCEQMKCYPKYQINDWEGDLVFTANGPCYATYSPCSLWCGNERFIICENENDADVAACQQMWGHRVLSGRTGLLSLRMPEELATSQKALLFGLLCLIHFQYYRKGGNGIYAFLVFLLVVACIAVGVFKFYGFF